MSLEKLKEKAAQYILSEEIIKKRENNRLSFIEKFPLNKLKELSLDQYVQGTDDNSFCYWLEFKNVGFGIGGGNASKFGIYKTKENSEIVYAVGNGKNKRLLQSEDAEKYYSSLLDKIIIALDYTRNNEIEKIKELDIPLWNMILQKILSLYYPEKFLTIGSFEVIIKCAKELELSDVKLTSDNLIQINHECKKALSSLPEYSNWPYEKLGTFIWEYYHGEKRKSPNNKQYWLYAPGESARNWEEIYSKGIMALGWDRIGNLTQYNSRDDIKKALVDAYGGVGSKKNDVSANDDFINKVKIGDIIIVKKGRSELLGYGVVTSDYMYDEKRSEKQKVRKVDWKKKGNWEVDFSLVLKTLTDITKYPSDHPDYDTYYERLLGIMDRGESEKSNRKEFTKWLTDKYGENSGTSTSYIRAIDILSLLVSGDIFKISDDDYLGTLYSDLIKEQNNPNGKYYHQDAPSYGSNGFYSASIKSYREFLKTSQKKSNQSESHMNFPLSTILYGPPGTGKTYKTILRAAEIIEERVIDSYNEALSIFKANLHERIEFITFHQNYSYEDFIQGLRPDTKQETEQLLFKKSDGVFKKIADRALKNLKESEKAPEELSKEKKFEAALSIFIDELNENDGIFKITENCQVFEVEEDAFRYTGDNWTRHPNGIRMKFSDLTEFYLNNVQSRKQIKSLDNINALAKQHATYYFGVYQKILKHVNEVKADSIEIKHKQNFVIVIDEINRANISRVFGELITLIEPDKRSNGSIPLEARLPSGDLFIVPSNLYIIGTMNTADKSIALLDIALRRRFEFESMYPLYAIDGHSIYDVDILQKINEQIIKLKGHDFQIGHSYFMGENDDLIVRMNKKVIPLLLEYFMNDVKEVKGILQSAGLIIEENSWPLRILGKNDQSL